MAQNKKWYRISKDVEYSTNYEFFISNQLRLIKSGNEYRFCSMLESKLFYEEHSLAHDGSFKEEYISKICERIHKEILNGEHGKGKFVD